MADNKCNHLWSKSFNPFKDGECLCEKCGYIFYNDAEEESRANELLNKEMKATKTKKGIKVNRQA